MAKMADGGAVLLIAAATILIVGLLAVMSNLGPLTILLACGIIATDLALTFVLMRAATSARASGNEPALYALIFVMAVLNPLTLFFSIPLLVPLTPTAQQG